MSRTLSGTKHDGQRETDKPWVSWFTASPGFFTAAGITVVAGRGIQPTDRTGTQLVAVLGRAAAEKYFDKVDDALGRSVVLSGRGQPDRSVTIVGVVSDTRNSQLTATSPQLYLPFDQWPSETMTFLMSSPDPVGRTADVRQVMRQLDRAVATSIPKTLRTLVEEDISVDRLTFLTRFKEVTAPYDGVITERRIDIGDLVTAGSTNTTSMFGVAQSERIRVFADVPQSARIDLVVGQVAKVAAAELPNRVFEGTITRTSQAADPRARTVRVEIDLANDDGALVPGIFVQVAFNLPPRSSVQVPASAMIFRGSGPQVALITGGDAVKFQGVSIARDNGKFVEIASGLAEGDRVAVNISNQIVDGEKVSVREITEDVPKSTK